ncbi:hypothetical protein [Hymenobacter rubidus]|uniref:hypothetical protein n=1 Tax=Hymenobacter rubidus TaxID=1441626 RepID=UPI00191C9FD4|nr:hypothetical protein [Hymenobacter rubidus]
MKTILFFFLLALPTLVPCLPAAAQAGREQSEALALYRQANTAPGGSGLRTAIRQQREALVSGGAFQFGTLRTFDGHNVLVPGLRYHPGLHLLEVQDSLNTDSTHLWPAGSLRGFDIGEAGDKETPLRRFRSRMVKEGSGGTRREFVEVLTAIDAGPMLLAWLYSVAPDAAASGHRPLVGILMAGPGTTGGEPLRPLEPTQSSVLHLFGSRSDDVRTFATEQHLDYTRPADIARMMDHYNRVAVVR